MSDEVLAEVPLLKEALAGDAERIRTEIASLSEEQMTFSQQEPVWARWSVDAQLRHIALLCCRWVNRVREPLEEKGHTFPDVNMDAVMGGNGRHMPADVCPDTPSLVTIIEAHLNHCLEVLERESPETLRGIAGERAVDSEASYTDSAERFIDFARLAARTHPYGWSEVADHPGRFRVELIALIRQIHWEILAHLRNVQRIKRLLGLPPAQELPREGYLQINKFWE